MGITLKLSFLCLSQKNSFSHLVTWSAVCSATCSQSIQVWSRFPIVFVIMTLLWHSLNCSDKGTLPYVLLLAYFFCVNRLQRSWQDDVWLPSPCLTFSSPLATLKANSTTLPAAMRDAVEVCDSFQVVSLSTCRHMVEATEWQNDQITTCVEMLRISVAWSLIGWEIPLGQ